MTAREIIRALERAGWFVHHHTGSHAVMHHPSNQRRVTVPQHRGTLKLGTLDSTIKQSGLSVGEVIDLLNG